MKNHLTFTAASRVYSFVPGVEAGDIADQLAARQTQLEALEAMTQGEAGKAFRALSDSQQEGFMWACSMIEREIQELTAALEERQAAATVPDEKHRSRLTLPFVVPDTSHGGITSHWCVPHDPDALYADGVAMGRRFFEAAASLAEFSEKQAVLALSLPMNKTGWRGGWGIECGFSEALAEAAIIGLRTLREAAPAGIGLDQANGNAALIEAAKGGQS